MRLINSFLDDILAEENRNTFIVQLKSSSYPFILTLAQECTCLCITKRTTEKSVGELIAITTSLLHRRFENHLLVCKSKQHNDGEYEIIF